MTYYRERYQLRAEDFPVAELMWQGSVSLPIFPTLREDELEYICATLWELLG
jgi:dTDP-4-amino-4,6-dideoxygalactose transaminase